MSDTAKLFITGRSQAVRLPLEYRFEGTEVYIRRDPATGDVVLSRRPGRIKSEHRMVFGGGRRPTPLEARARPEFNDYFRTLWDELDVHVEG